MATHEPWRPERAAEIIALHAHLDGAAIPILHALQEAFGHVPHDAVTMIAETLNLSRADIHGVLTFYHDFRAAPPGRRILKLCRAEACQAAGAVALHDAVRRRLGVDWHGTTADGALTLEPVFCLGLCACAPAALLDDEPLGRLDEASLDQALRGGAGARA